MSKINATNLWSDVEQSRREADAVLEDAKSTSLEYAEKLADLVDCVGVFGQWMLDSEAKDIPSQWTDPISAALDSPF